MLTIFTIVLNGMPYIKRHMDEFTKLKIPWQWRIVEGVSLGGDVQNINLAIQIIAIRPLLEKFAKAH